MTRERLEDRRASETFEFAHAYPGNDPHVFTATAGFYADLRVGEAFVSTVDGKAKLVTVDAHDACVLVSFALQHGADLKTMAAAMLRSEGGSPQGFMGALLDALVMAYGDGR